MRRPYLLAIAWLVAACSGVSPTSASDFELATNAATYERIPGVPPPALTVTLHNNADNDISIVVCNQSGTPTALIQYQQLQEAGNWVNIPFSDVTCDAEGTSVPVAPGTTWIAPPEAQDFPPDAGTYRIVLLPDNSSVDFSIVSNSFTVITGFEPTS